MKLEIKILPLIALTMASSSAHAQSVHLDFDAFPNNAVITNQYPEAIFSSEPGFVNVATTQNLGTSLPNFLCTARAGGGLDCTADTYVDFPVPVSNLTLLTTGDDDAGRAAMVDVYVGGSLAGTVTVVTDGLISTPNFVDLRAFSGVTRIEIRDITDPFGLGWDDFMFDVDLGVKYCVANSNATGSPADISATGSASSAAGSLQLQSAPVPHHYGMFFHGSGQTQIPFGRGFLCVIGGIARGALVFPVANASTYTFDNSDARHSLAAYVGTTRHFQHWYRDPHSGGRIFNLSNAISIPIVP